MNPTIQVQINAAAAALLQGKTAERATAGLIRELDRQNELTIGAVVRDRLSFPPGGDSTPEGLRVQTGRLRRSITRAAAQRQGDRILSAIGSNVAYFGPHEFGFKGSVTVPAHERRLPRSVRTSDGGRMSLTAAAREGLITKTGRRTRDGVKADIGVLKPKGLAQVKEHTRRVSFPARRMVQRTVESRLGSYSRALSRAIVEAVQNP